MSQTAVMDRPVDGRDAHAAERLKRQAAESSNGVRRKVVTLMSYFGASKLTTSVRQRMLLAFAAAELRIEPPLDIAKRDQFVRLYMDSSNSVGLMPEINAAIRKPLPDLIEDVAPAVVHIMHTNGSGSGFALDTDGFVLTNAHVVAPEAEHLVRMSNGKTSEATIVGIDTSTDLAVLHIEGSTAFPALEFRPLKSIRVGERVLAVGSPLGLEWTVTRGIIGGLNRTIIAPDGQHIDYVLQTDATINPGNSGGPLISEFGDVVGVNAQILTGSGLGFAIPSDTAKAVYGELREYGSVERGALGARAATMPFFGEKADELGQDGGAILTGVKEGRPAAMAGLKEGDIILSLDGELVDEPGDIFRLLNRDRIGKPCPVSFLREDDVLEGEVTPAPRRA